MSQTREAVAALTVAFKAVAIVAIASPVFSLRVLAKVEM